MRIEGRCHCGAIAWRAEIDPAEVYVCHCTDCQAISGSPYRWAVTVPAAAFELVAGKPAVHVKRKTASGRPNEQHFCQGCGASIYAVTPGAAPAVLRVRLGTMRTGAVLGPRRQLWCRSAQPWAIIPGVERLETQ